MRLILLSILLLGPVVAVKSQVQYIKEVNFAVATWDTQILALKNSRSIICTNDSTGTTALIALDECGELLWVKKFSGDTYFADAIVTSDGEIAITGWNGNYGGVIFLIILDEDGSVKLSKQYAVSNHYSFVYSIHQKLNGDILIRGKNSPVGGGLGEDFLLTLSDAGVPKSMKEYHKSGSWGRSVLNGSAVLNFTAATTYMVDANGSVAWSAQHSNTYNRYHGIPNGDGFIVATNAPGSKYSFVYGITNTGLVDWRSDKFAITDLTGVYASPDGNIVLAGTAVDSATLLPAVGIILLDYQGKFVRSKLISVDGKGINFSALAFDGQQMLLTGKVGTNFRGNLYVARVSWENSMDCIEDAAVPSLQNSLINIESIAVPLSETTCTPSAFVTTTGELTIGNEFICKKETLPLISAVDTSVCSDSLVLAFPPGPSYSLPGAVSLAENTFMISETGKYSLRVSSRCDSLSGTVPIEVNVHEAPVGQAPIDTLVCIPAIFNFEASGSYGYSWSDGVKTGTREFPNSGTYILQTSNECGSTMDTLTIGYIDCTIVPNVFTPNQDAQNDFFGLDRTDGIESGTITIYNRWGESMFSGAFNEMWDGTNRGRQCAEGTYFWQVQYLLKNGEVISKKGSLSLLR